MQTQLYFDLSEFCFLVLVLNLLQAAAPFGHHLSLYKLKHQFSPFLYFSLLIESILLNTRPCLVNVQK